MNKFCSVALTLIISQTAYSAPPVAAESVLTSQDQRLLALADKLCLSPDKNGSQWDVTGGTKVAAKAPIRIVKLEGDIDFRFNKQQWQGVQRVLPAHQLDEHKRYSDCTSKLLPVLEKIVYAAKTTQRTGSQGGAAKPARESSRTQGDCNVVISGNVSGSTVQPNCSGR